MGPPPPCCRQEGGASYHDYTDVRMCAHKSLPKGTALTVTNLANGKQTTCVVNDRGPYVEGRILDLSKTAFSEIASLSDGVIRVSIEWSA
jgi:rare lipoprotein A